LRQYVSILAGRATIEGAELEAAARRLCNKRNCARLLPDDACIPPHAEISAELSDD
jgi:hypothetical protein